MKLLNRTIKSYLVYSVILLLLSTPLFYFAIQKLFVHEIDRVLRSHKQDFNDAHDYLKTEKDLKFFHLMNKEFQLTPRSSSVVRDSLYTISMYDSSSREMMPYRVFITGVTVDDAPYELQVRESMVSSIRLIGAIMATQIILLTLLLAGLILINRRLSKRVWDPFYVILEKLKKYQIDRDADLELPRSSIAEFRDLNAAITQLVDKNQEAYFNQKEFTENAAHELQTPLAICRTKLELLAQSRELTLEQSELIGHMMDSMGRITRLNKDLLLLSKIENRQFMDMEQIDLQPIVNRSIETYKRQAEEKQLAIECKLRRPMLVRANLILLEVLANNVISNAVRHAPQNGFVIVDGENNSMTVSNNGPPLQHPEKIFHRFHRESRSTFGSGLGLSIAKKVCDVSEYKIVYKYHSSIHQFIITF